MKTVLFLCSGNYYRSRFAEYLFRHLASDRQLDWTSDSRGLALDSRNPGPISSHTIDECRRLGFQCEPMRPPQTLTEQDLESAELVIAVKETEHRPLMQRLFPNWENRIEYWEIHDIDYEEPNVALPRLKIAVERLVDRLADESA